MYSYIFSLLIAIVCYVCFCLGCFRIRLFLFSIVVVSAFSFACFYLLLGLHLLQLSLLLSSVSVFLLPALLAFIFCGVCFCVQRCFFIAAAYLLKWADVLLFILFKVSLFIKTLSLNKMALAFFCFLEYPICLPLAIICFFLCYFLNSFASNCILFNSSIVPFLFIRVANEITSNSRCDYMAFNDSVELSAIIKVTR